jgi:hypothetical protein
MLQKQWIDYIKIHNEFPAEWDSEKYARDLFSKFDGDEGHWNDKMFHPLVHFKMESSDGKAEVHYNYCEKCRSIRNQYLVEFQPNNTCAVTWVAKEGSKIK